ncbi:MAG: endonuclease/exonuclease/phosphatase family protein [Bacteroidetes bacterium]|jgi:endonuclease/exonuclease/phosphatase family metal-dependent hydrolase|nr:endonuclease/exonuclease/phosphatase family protein [Bacteroidota bacterium]MBT6687787.1 endonuclease/exonuclease/phosphatase family protein [Bacteroidota bacterium]MBT7143152.1 endonuclease/exonuclease/phosphatase family protein [Bacteroidota bacterium]MBT7490656.1 endonuclease/exonuclease/phosphatase family protein [Bacteroidota bacterium]
MKKLVLLSFVFLTSCLTAGWLFGQSYKIMSYNIRYDNSWDSLNSWEIRKTKVAELINFHNPCIFGIQEGLFNQLQFLDSCLVNYKYFGIGREDGINKGEFCAIFFDKSKFQILEQSTFWLSETPDTVSVGWDAALERICTFGLFEDKINNNKFWVFNTHFDHQGSYARDKSALLIIERIKELNTENLPVVLMGDINSLPGSAPIQNLETFLTDALKISEKPFYGPIGTFNGFDANKIILERIDYFFTNKFKILSYSHIDDRLNDNKFISDHLPVFVIVETGG